jgi:hypothetical protein
MRQYDVVSCLMFLLPFWQTVSFLAQTCFYHSCHHFISHLRSKLLNLSGDPAATDLSCLRGEAMNDEFSKRIIDVGSKLAFCILKCNELMVAYTFENWDVVQITLPILRRTRKGCGRTFHHRLHLHMGSTLSL